MSTSNSDSDVAPTPKRLRRSSSSPSPPPSRSDDASPASDSEEQESSKYDSSDEEDYHPNASNPFLSLPVEIMDRIVAYTGPWSYYCRNPYLRQICAVSRAMYDRYHIKIITDGCVDGQGMENLYFLEDAEKGSFGWQPFIIWGGQSTDDEDISYLFEGDEEIDVYMDVAPLDPEQFKPNKATNSYFFLRWNDEEVWIDNEYWDDVFMDDALTTEEWKSWKWDLRDSIVTATPELLRERFTCPECEGSKEVEYGTQSLAKRWPSLEPSEFRFDIPCPRCTVCLEYAVELVEEIIEEMLGDTDDDEEEEEEDEEE